MRKGRHCSPGNAQYMHNRNLHMRGSTVIRKACSQVQPVSMPGWSIIGLFATIWQSIHYTQPALSTCLVMQVCSQGELVRWAAQTRRGACLWLHTWPCAAAVATGFQPPEHRRPHTVCITRPAVRGLKRTGLCLCSSRCASCCCVKNIAALQTHP